jgi:EmrB/QacA subfamily drug resistance transporter
MSAISAGRSAALAVILTVQLMLAMDFLIVIVSLHHIQKDLGFTAAGLSWVPNAFGLAFGGLLLLGGRLGDIIGQVKAFRIGLAIFVVASVLGGLAPSAFLFILARVLQGIGAALAGPSVLALITLLATNEAEKNRGLSLFVAISSMGASAGLILGGALTEFLSWRWSLLINAPIGILAFFAIAYLVPETNKVKGKVDFAGAVTGTLGSTGLVYGFISAAENGWGSILTISSFIAALVLFTLFYRFEGRVTDPLLKLSLLRPKPRQGGLVVMALIVGMHFATLFLLIQYFEEVLKLSPLMAGVAYIPLTAIVFIFSQFVPRLVRRFGVRNLLTAGAVLVALSLMGFAQLNESSNYSIDILIPLFLHSIGIALVFTPGSIVVLDGVEDSDAGIASGVLQMSQQIGGAVGIASIITIYTAYLVPQQFSSGFQMAFSAAAIIAAAAALITRLTIPSGNPVR